MPKLPSATEDRTLVPLNVRVEEDVSAALIAWAEAEERSVAGQIRMILRAAIPPEYFEVAK
jgi:hypothetical protein